MPRALKKFITSPPMTESKIREVLNVIYQVNSELGIGFLEKVYENALLLALRQADFDVEAQKPIEVRFRGHIVGDYYADILVDSALLIELKSCSALKPEHSAQVINYLKAGKIKDGLLVNFGKKPTEIKRLYNQ